jgi:NAD(P)H-flavin reductase
MIINRATGPRKQIGKVTRKILIAENVFEIDIELEEACSYEAGQYVSLKVSENGVRRSYSVAEYKDNIVRLVVDITPMGMGSVFINNLVVGDSVEVMGFLGRFVLEEKEAISADTVYFVATGTGVAPFLPMIKELLEDGFKGKVVLWWGLRHKRGIYWVSELNDLKEKYSNFEFDIYLSQPESEWSGKTGHVGDDLETIGFENTVWYLCGATAMIEQMKNKLREKQVPEELINYEKFY